MDLYYNNRKIATLPITPEYTLGQVKAILSDWLYPQGIAKCRVRIMFNNGTELSQIVFIISGYDDMNFRGQGGTLSGGQIRVSSLDFKDGAEGFGGVVNIKPTTAEGLNTLTKADLEHLLTSRGQQKIGRKTKQELINMVLNQVRPRFNLPSVK